MQFSALPLSQLLVCRQQEEGAAALSPARWTSRSLRELQISLLVRLPGSWGAAEGGRAHPQALEAAVSRAGCRASTQPPADSDECPALGGHSGFQPFWPGRVLSIFFRVGFSESSSMALQVPMMLCVSYISLKSRYVTLVNGPNSSWQGKQYTMK